MRVIKDEELRKALEQWGYEEWYIKEHCNNEGGSQTLDFSRMKIKEGEDGFEAIDKPAPMKIAFPFGVNNEDDYETCCKKVGKKAEYVNINEANSRVWLVPKQQNNLQMSFTIMFHDSELKGFNMTSQSVVNEEDIGSFLWDNED